MDILITPSLTFSWKIAEHRVVVKTRSGIVANFNLQAYLQHGLIFKEVHQYVMLIKPFQKIYNLESRLKYNLRRICMLFLLERMILGKLGLSLIQVLSLVATQSN